MKILRKIFSVLLCITLFAGLVPAVAADTEADTENVYGERANALIATLGIAEYTVENLEETITKGEFCQLLSELGGYDRDPLGIGTYADMSKEHTYAAEIQAIINAGLIKPVLGRVYPDSIIKLDDAATMLVKLLGYTRKAEIAGGFVHMANKLGLFSGIGYKKNIELTKGMAVQLIYNALGTNVLERDNYGDGSYTLKEGNTLAYTRYGVIYVKGVVSGVDISRLMGENDVQPFHIEVAGYELESRNVQNVYEYLGYEVELFYKEKGDDRKYDKIFYMNKTLDNNEVKIQIENIASIQGNTVNYYTTENNRSKKMSYKKGVPVVYNGVATKRSFNMAMVKDKLGNIVMLDNNDDGKADVVFVNVYQNYITGFVDKDKFVLYDLYNTSETLPVDVTVDDPYTIIFDSEGKECKPGKLTKDTLVSVYRSDAKPDVYQEYIRIYIINDVVTGTIEKTKDNGKVVVVGETDYKLTPDCKTNDKGYIALGAFVNLHLDIDGRVARVTQGAETAMQYAYIMGADVEESAFDKKLRFKVFTENGDFITAYVSKTFRIDDVAYKNAQTGTNNINDALTRLNEASKVVFGNNTSYSSLVQLSINAKGEINKIDTVLKKDGTTASRASEPENNDILFSMNAPTGGDELFAPSYNRYGTQILMNNEAMVMLYPTPNEPGELFNEDKYAVMPYKSILTSGTQITGLTAYWTDKNRIETSFLGLIYDQNLYGKVSGETGFSVVKELAKSLGEDGEIIDVITVLVSEGTVDIPAKAGFEVTSTVAVSDGLGGTTTTLSVPQLKLGDVIRYKLDKNGMAGGINLLYRASTKEEATTFSTTAFRDSQTKKGSVFAVYPDAILVYVGVADTNDEDGDGNTTEMKDIQYAKFEDCQIVRPGSATVYKYGTATNGENYVALGSIGDLKPYSIVNTGYSEVIMQLQYGTARAILTLEN